MVSVVYTFFPSMVWFRGVYTMKARNGFGGVHHGGGLWIFVVYTILNSYFRACDADQMYCNVLILILFVFTIKRGGGLGVTAVTKAFVPKYPHRRFKS